MIVVKIVFSLSLDENNEFKETKRVCCSVFGSSVKAVLRVKKSFEVTLAISGNFMDRYRTYLNLKMPFGNRYIKKLFKIRLNGNHANYDSLSFKGGVIGDAFSGLVGCVIEKDIFSYR